MSVSHALHCLVKESRIKRETHAYVVDVLDAKEAIEEEKKSK